MDWEGEITACRGEDFRIPGVLFPIDVSLSASLGFNPYLRTASIEGGKLTYPLPEPFDEITEYIHNGSTWSDIFDGEGTIGIYYLEPVSSDFINIIESGSIQLKRTKLIVEGTIIPEPNSFILMLIGLGSIKFKNKLRMFQSD